MDVTPTTAPHYMPVPFPRWMAILPCHHIFYLLLPPLPTLCCAVAAYILLVYALQPPCHYMYHAHSVVSIVMGRAEPPSRRPHHFLRSPYHLLYTTFCICHHATCHLLSPPDLSPCYLTYLPPFPSCLPGGLLPFCHFPCLLLCLLYFSPSQPMCSCLLPVYASFCGCCVWGVLGGGVRQIVDIWGLQTHTGKHRAINGERNNVNGISINSEQWPPQYQ